MRTYEETARRVLARRDSYNAENKGIYVWKRRVLPAAAAALIIAGGAGAYALTRPDTGGPVTGGSDSQPSQEVRAEGGGLDGAGYTGPDGEPIQFGNDGAEHSATYDPETDTYTDDNGAVHDVPGEEEGPSDDSQAELARIPEWDEMGFYEQYSTLDPFGTGAEYTSSGRLVQEGDVGESLGHATLNGYDQITDEPHSADCEVFGLTGISRECAVAVRGEGQEGLCVYQNHLYRPETLGQFVLDLDLRNDLRLGTAVLTEYDDQGWTETVFADPETYEARVDTAAVLDILFADGDIPNIGDSVPMESSRAYIELEVNIPELGIEGLGMWLSEDGYLQTNILATLKAFYVGPEKVAELESYLRGNYFEKTGRTNYNDIVPDMGDDIME